MVFWVRAANELRLRRVAFVSKFLMDSDFAGIVAVDRHSFEANEEVF